MCRYVICWDSLSIGVRVDSPAFFQERCAFPRVIPPPLFFTTAPPPSPITRYLMYSLLFGLPLSHISHCSIFLFYPIASHCKKKKWNQRKLLVIHSSLSCSDLVCINDQGRWWAICVTLYVKIPSFTQKDHVFDLAFRTLPKGNGLCVCAYESHVESMLKTSRWLWRTYKTTIVWDVGLWWFRWTNNIAMWEGKRHGRLSQIG